LGAWIAKLGTFPFCYTPLNQCEKCHIYVIKGAELNSTTLFHRICFWTEIYGSKRSKTIGGSKLIFGLKNLNKQIMPHSKERMELSRKTPKSTESDLI